MLDDTLRRIGSWAGSKRQAQGAEDNTHFDAQVEIMGNLKSKNPLEFWGKIAGELQGDSVTIGATGEVDGPILAQDLYVYGKCVGDIKAQRVTLCGSAHVQGEIYCQSLAVEHGAYFEGKVRRLQSTDSGVTSKLSATNGELSKELVCLSPDIRVDGWWRDRGDTRLEASCRPQPQ
jgi:cytoskeletal protein CcmA (bactofilin family)